MGLLETRRARDGRRGRDRNHRDGRLCRWSLRVGFQGLKELGKAVGRGTRRDRGRRRKGKKRVVGDERRRYAAEFGRRGCCGSRIRMVSRIWIQIGREFPVREPRCFRCGFGLERLCRRMLRLGPFCAPESGRWKRSRLRLWGRSDFCGICYAGKRRRRFSRRRCHQRGGWGLKSLGKVVRVELLEELCEAGRRRG